MNANSKIIACVSAALLFCALLPLSCASTAIPAPSSPAIPAEAKAQAPFAKGVKEKAVSFEGRWVGTLEIGAQKLGIVFNIAKDGEAYSATADSPDQKAYGLRVESVTVEGKSIKLAMPDLLAEFEGLLSDDGKMLEGSFTQRGYALALKLSRAAAADASPEAEPRSAYNWKDVEIPYAGGHALAGTLVWPEGEGPFPVCILVTGSGPQNRDEELFGKKPFRVLAEALAAAGIASLRYDDRGCYDSTGDFASATTLDLADDAISAAEYARGQKAFPVGKVGVVGHSEGGLIAAILSAGGAIDFSAMIAGPSVPGYDIIMEQARAIGAAQGMSEDQLAEAAEANARIYALAMSDMEAGPLVEEGTRGIASYGLSLDDASAQAAELASPWFRTFLALDPAPYLARSVVPVLAIYGGKDLQVLAAQNEGPARAAMAGKPGSDVLVLEGMNHLFQKAGNGSPDEYALLPGVFDEEMLSVLIEWLKGVAC